MDSLRALLTIFYDPPRGMALTRDRAPLAQAILLSLVVQAIYVVVIQALYQNGFSHLNPLYVTIGLSGVGRSWLFSMLGFVPALLMVGNLFEKRDNALGVIKQEYAPFASCILYAQIVATIIAIPLALLIHFTGIDSAYVTQSLQQVPQIEQYFPAEVRGELRNPRIYLEGIYNSAVFPFYIFFSIVAVREVFGFGWLRSLVVLILGTILMIPIVLVLAVVINVVGPMFSSPLLLLLLFFYLRGYLGGLAQTQRARLSFKQNLEAATLNPADASAHYNLGLLHLQKKQIDEARERFEKAVSVDPEEVDAHYQLGRIARTQNRLSDAIQHFSEVVSRDDSHAQNEVWREIGATYVAAGQFQDAHDALEKFLDRRQMDAQGLYLMGRAQAGLGDLRGASDSMQACIEAVKTSPAYKYRTEKRWLNEARDFLKSKA